MKEQQIWGRGEVNKEGLMGGGGGCNLDVLYERRIKGKKSLNVCFHLKTSFESSDTHMMYLFIKLIQIQIPLHATKAMGKSIP